MIFKITILIILILCGLSCHEDNFDQKSFNFMAEEIKTQFNKFDIPCGLQDKIELNNKTESTINGLSNQIIKLKKYKKHELYIDDLKVDFIINKANENGFQFKYSTDLIDYQIDKKPIITRDEGTIWMYCDKYKKHNLPKSKKPTSPTGVMITVE